jgi:hypothetical protein
MREQEPSTRIGRDCGGDLPVEMVDSGGQPGQQLEAVIPPAAGVGTSCLIGTTLFAVATACWFLHFRSDSDNRSGWSQIPMILGASAYGFGTTLALYFLYGFYRLATLCARGWFNQRRGRRSP